jgi:hypothetical protein
MVLDLLRGPEPLKKTAQYRRSAPEPPAAHAPLVNPGHDD